MPTEIFIYKPIGPECNVSTLQGAFDALGDVEEMSVRIHSPGGEVLESVAMANRLIAHPARVVTKIDGLAASMAGVLAMAGDEVEIAENAWLVLHNPWVKLQGEAGDLRREADLLDALKTSLIRDYQRHTPLDAERLSALMDAETWLDAEQALELGFVTRITQRRDVSAQLYAPAFARIPEGARAFFLPTPNGGTEMPKEKSGEPAPKPDAPQKPPEEKPAVEDEPTAPKADDEPKRGAGLLASLGRLLGLGKTTLDEDDLAAVLDIERRALGSERAELAVERTLAAHRDRIEPADLKRLEPVLVKLKRAELAGDDDAGATFAGLASLLPRLGSPRAGGELAGDDDAALTADDSRPPERAAFDAERFSADRVAELMRKYPGCRAGAR